MKRTSLRGTHVTEATTVTMRDIARKTGFSSTTVSFVLNRAPLSAYVAAATKKKIEAAAKKLGYRPNPFARSLRTRRSYAVGIAVFDMTDPFCTLVLRGIENALYEASYVPVLTDIRNEPTRFERFLEMLLDRRLEGLIVVANRVFLDIHVPCNLGKSRVPAVVVGGELKNDSISSINVDNELGTHTAIEHLHALGHRKIAFIRGPKMLADTVPRWRGMRSFAQANALELNPGLIMDLPDSSDPNSRFEAGFELTERLIRQHDSFTALLAFDDLTAFGAIRALAKAGLGVPDNCSVVGFDDVAASSLYNPPLTTVRKPMEIIGGLAASVVLDRITALREERKIAVVHRKVPPEFVIRESSRCK
jgi:DNA-binding LacI/PurR family transcriptional regulator